MELVICDTNIWYDFANSKINEKLIKDFKLIGTSVNILEISSTPNLINNIELVVKVVKELHNHHYRIIKTNPMEHLITIFHDNYYPDGKVEERLLNGFYALMEIDINNVPTENINIAVKQIDKIMTQQYSVTEQINNGLQIIREEIKRKVGKKNHRKIDFTPTWKKFISELVSVYSKQYYDKVFTLDINDKKWEKLEFFIYTWEAYFKNLELNKSKFDKNDWGDLFNLVYVQPNFKYWTMEKKMDTTF